MILDDNACWPIVILILFMNIAIFPEDYQQQKWVERLNNFLNSNFFSILIWVMTVYSLFSDDVRQISVNKNGDYYFYGFTSFAMATFVTEIVLSCLVKPDYFNGVSIE